MDKEAKLFELNKGWVWIKLSDITLPITRTNKTFEDPHREFKYIDIEAINNNSQTIKEVKTYTWENAPSRAQQIVEIDDILFATVRPYLKNIAIVTNQHNKSIASSGFCVLRTFIVNPKYIYYYILTQHFIDSVNLFAKGTSYPAVTNKIILEQKIPLAPLNEQDQIVEKIETFFSELNQAEKVLQNTKQQLEIYTQALLKSAFEGKLTENWRNNNQNFDANLELADIKNKRKSKYQIEFQEGIKKNPKINYNFEFEKNNIIHTWANANLDNLIGINARIGWRGLTKKEYTKKGALFLSVHALNYGKNVVFKDANYITFERYDESPEIKLKINDILLCKDGAGIGKIGIIKNLPDKTTVNSSLLVIDAKEVFNPDFLYYFFLGPTMQELVNEKISGSAIPHLFQKDIKKFNLKVPPRQEQDQIVEILESRFALIENLEKSISNILSGILILRHSILKKAFAGKLVKQDFNDDPVSELLHKIKIKKRDYLNAQKELEKLKPKIKRQMETKRTVLEILGESKNPISAQKLWENSVHNGDIEGFYSEIKEIYNELTEVKEEMESLLSLRK